MVTVLLVADMFNIDPSKVASDVVRKRHQAALILRKDLAPIETLKEYLLTIYLTKSDHPITASQKAQDRLVKQVNAWAKTIDWDALREEEMLELRMRIDSVGHEAELVIDGEKRRGVEFIPTR